MLRAPRPRPFLGPPEDFDALWAEAVGPWPGRLQSHLGDYGRRVARACVRLRRPRTTRATLPWWSELGRVSRRSAAARASCERPPRVRRKCCGPPGTRPCRSPPGRIAVLAGTAFPRQRAAAGRPRLCLDGRHWPAPVRRCALYRSERDDHLLADLTFERLGYPARASQELIPSVKGGQQ